ncbi:hypothetical protein G6F56_002866 [Rhizopus delemar]|nr:hypothetical protein G6F56_002866 [Rhizopus delemar]
MQSKGMRPQVESQQLMFRGTVYTDGVGISILKQNHDSKKKRSGGKQKKAYIDDDVPYVHTLSKKQLLADIGKCILVDPGRRDMLYCMHESSTIQIKSLYRYTNNQRNVETKTRKFRKFRENSQLEKFKEVNNPRPFRRNTRPKVICHGLLRCTNQQCLKDADTPRLWNRDLVATLNFRKILFELRKNDTRPICFRRPSTNYASKQKGSFSDEYSGNKRHKANPL